MNPKLIHIVGARPNFMKLAPLYKALSATIFKQKIIHTGQHYDVKMSDVFFEELQIPSPDYHLGVGSGSHTEQTAKIMLAIEPILLQEKPNCVIVYGDVNSTLAAALVCAKMQIPLAHVEAGLRSFDYSMPEEINRILTDRISNFLFTPSEDANQNLLNEGIKAEKIFFVGNIMIDTLTFALQNIQQFPQRVIKSASLIEEFGEKNYILSTVHRPSNVDDQEALRKLFNFLKKIAQDIPIVLPIHPRTQKHLQENLDIFPLPAQMKVIEPLGYLDFVNLQKNALCILTDSGGVQEESSVLHVPCFTLRPNTERPITITLGTNMLVGDNFDLLADKIQEVKQGKIKSFQEIPLWDGKTAHRISEVLQKIFNS
ncbi:MAG: UDP-N-acetylglucosamine 2-epimerase (non-hydrolyzing) [Raineya sp.]|nr:UDP-N-acetylglucosamine 2-epimerase (non-hydrolyzing) [Raineya sp.]